MLMLIAPPSPEKADKFARHARRDNGSRMAADRGMIRLDEILTRQARSTRRMPRPAVTQAKEALDAGEEERRPTPAAEGRMARVAPTGLEGCAVQIRREMAEQRRRER
jgi:hypothetical protein